MTNQPTDPNLKTPSVQTAPQPVQANHPQRIENLNVLGYYLDGWADLIEGMGDRAEQVKQVMLQHLIAKRTSNVTIRQVIGIDRTLASRKREYVLTATSPGFVTAIFIRKNAQDLYVSWKTYLKPVLNLVLIAIMGAIALAFGFLSSFTMYNNLNDYRFLGTESICFTSLCTFLFIVIGFFLVEVVLVAFVSRALKNDIFALFFLDPTIFDVDDVLAMNFSVHKSLLRALDQSGIDMSKLRLKRDFKGGRRGEGV